MLTSQVSNYKDFVDNVVSYLVHPVEDNYDSSTQPSSNHNNNGGHSYDSHDNHDNDNHNHNNNQTSTTSMMRIFNNGPKDKSTIPFGESMHQLQEQSMDERDDSEGGRGGGGDYQEQEQQGLTSGVIVNGGNGKGNDRWVFIAVFNLNPNQITTVL